MRISKYFQTTAFTYENGALRVRKIDEIKFLDVITVKGGCLQKGISKKITVYQCTSPIYTTTITVPTKKDRYVMESTDRPDLWDSKPPKTVTASIS